MNVFGRITNICPEARKCSYYHTFCYPYYAHSSPGMSSCELPHCTLENGNAGAWQLGTLAVGQFDSLTFETRNRTLSQFPFWNTSWTRTTELIGFQWIACSLLFHNLSSWIQQRNMIEALQVINHIWIYEHSGGALRQDNLQFCLDWSRRKYKRQHQPSPHEVMAVTSHNKLTVPYKSS